MRETVYWWKCSENNTMSDKDQGQPTCPLSATVRTQSLANTIDYTSTGKSTSPAKICCPWWNNSILAREEISSFFFWLWLWLLQDACLEFGNWASIVEPNTGLDCSSWPGVSNLLTSQLQRDHLAGDPRLKSSPPRGTTVHRLCNQAGSRGVLNARHWDIGRIRFTEILLCVSRASYPLI